MPSDHALRLAPAALAALATVALAACEDRGTGGAAEAGRDTLAGLETLRPDAEVAVTVTFEGAAPDSVVARFLDEHSLQPFAVYLVVEGLTGVYREPREHASLEVIARARAEAAATLTNSVCAQQGRAAALLEPADPGARAGLEALRRLLADFHRLERAVASLPEEEPVIYAVQALGTPADVRSARADPQARITLPRDLGAEGGGTPPEPAPSAVPDTVPAEIAALPDDAVVRRARELAGRGLEECHDYPGRETAPPG